MMKVLLLFVGAMTVYEVSCALTQLEIDNKWSEFKVSFNRNYTDEKEEQLRKNIFTENVKKIEEHNEKYRQGLTTFTMGVNDFADKTPQEIRPFTHGVLSRKP